MLSLVEKIQPARIVKVYDEEFPGCPVTFVDAARPYIRFNVKTQWGLRLSNAWPHWPLSQVEGWTDDELRRAALLLCGLSR